MAVLPPQINSGTTTLLASDLLTSRTVISGNFVYRGLAKPGSSEDDAVWLIVRTEDVGGAGTTYPKLFANGVATFSSLWTGYAGFSYS